MRRMKLCLISCAVLFATAPAFAAGEMDHDHLGAPTTTDDPNAASQSDPNLKPESGTLVPSDRPPGDVIRPGDPGAGMGDGTMRAPGDSGTRGGGKPGSGGSTGSSGSGSR